MLNKTKKVTVLGLGYIGLPTAALLASNGYEVAGFDIKNNVVDTINKGEIHIVEPDLDAYVRSAVSSKKLQAYNQPQSADVYMICVPTPFKGDSHEPNLEFVLEATKSISRLIKKEDIIILESTSPVGTTEMIKDVLKAQNVDTSSIYIAYCPERVLPGKIMSELVSNDRVIGGINDASTKMASEFYKTFVKGEILETESKTAEMCKLTENSFRDVNIAFANELSMICDTHKIDVWSLIELANHHPRVNILQPGTGVGGHCIAVDPWFIVSGDPKNSKIVKTARDVNNSKPQWIVSMIQRFIDNSSNKNPKIACLGLAFKPNIDDLRESPAIEVVNLLIEQGKNIIVVEPNISNHEELILRNIEEAIQEAEIIVILVNHVEFSSHEIKEKFKGMCVLDFCGALQ
tara:strand:- start:2816 stop:4027 length:1212 start_codon:yes stop_codon:yes gene_type:complete